MDERYGAWETTRENLTERFNELKSAGLRSIHVTYPLKKDILNLVDEIDPSAKAVNAANLIIKKNDQWIAFNTDGIGFRHFLEYEHIDVCNKTISVIGAGATAHAIVHQLLNINVLKINITNRTRANAELLIGFFNHDTRLTHDFGDATSDILINATPCNLVASNSDRHKTIIDVNYSNTNPGFTGQYFNGLGLLFFQARESFYMWTKKELPITIYDELKNRK